MALIEKTSVLGGAGINTGRIREVSMVGETEASLREKGIAFVAGRANYADLPRREIIGDETGFLKLLFRREDMRLPGVHVIGEQATELAHIGLVAMLAEADAPPLPRPTPRRPARSSARGSSAPLCCAMN